MNLIDFKTLPTIIVPLRATQAWLQQIVNNGSGVEFATVDLTPLIELELVCLLSDPKARRWSDSYERFFEHYLVMPEAELAITNRMRNLIGDPVVESWGRINRHQEYSWSIAYGNLFIFHRQPLRLRARQEICRSWMAA